MIITVGGVVGVFWGILAQNLFRDLGVKVLFGVFFTNRTLTKCQHWHFIPEGFRLNPRIFIFGFRECLDVAPRALLWLTVWGLVMG